MSNERSTISKIDDSSFIEEPSENVIAEVQEVKDSGRQRMLKIGGGIGFGIILLVAIVVPCVIFLPKTEPGPSTDPLTTTKSAASAAPTTTPTTTLPTTTAAVEISTTVYLKHLVIACLTLFPLRLIVLGFSDLLFCQLINKY
ncbi:unnamed protein product [Oikopleura dioica]|uniref:Uncharacterized protein n=1 Tax=Oikopleura dioica TaxID=34765 RepID=E4Y7L7_OIKDI|nr:unnamed protein product [Oikopleura dioica]